MVLNFSQKIFTYRLIKFLHQNHLEMKQKNILPLLISWLVTQFSWSQAVFDPLFPQEGETVKVIYNANLGVSSLQGASSIHMHSGTITTAGGTTWTNVVSTWGDPSTPGQMTSLGNDLWEFEFNPSARTYHNVPSNETVYRLGTVFRESGPCGGFGGASTNCGEGKSFTNNDIYLDFYDPSDGLLTGFVAPMTSNFFASLNEVIEINAQASQDANLTLEITKPISGTTNMSMTNAKKITTNVTANEAGTYHIKITATNMNGTSTNDIYFVVSPSSTTQARPTGIIPGINYNTTDNTKATLCLEAPGKNTVYAVGDFNNWALNTNYQMKQDGDFFWIELTGLTPNTEYALQYIVDESIYTTDPYADKILDPFDDPFIPNTTYPNLKPYPSQGQGMLAIIETGQTPYTWVNTGFVRPTEEDLVVYEMWIYDFVHEKRYQSLIDTLDYLEDLGINAIELMPIGEFKGNISWGYNPNFYFAVDKFYGTKNKFKEFIDECHGRGIAVILDIVMNHVQEASPFAQLYWDNTNFKPASDNPWLNPDATHPFNVFFDFNHESTRTQALLDRINKYWIEEYKVDGYRFDLSKGFTQNAACPPDDVGCWNNYNAGRIGLLKRMADVIWTEDPDFYVMLEHLSENNEEKELADYRANEGKGMLLWGNMNHNYNQATMGYGSDNSLNWTYHGTRGWNEARAVAYMESHDEERLMYRNINFGNVSGSYDTRNLSTALDRMKQAAAFFFTIPGPKMLWQFGEVGFDFSINRCDDGTISNDCRLTPKPIRWDYTIDPDREKLLKVYTALIDLKTQQANMMNNGTFSLDESQNQGLQKIIKIEHSSMNMVVIGNFDVQTRTFNVTFPNTGNWYDYFSEDFIELTGSTTLSFTMEPGQFHVLTNNELSLLEADLVPFLLPNRVISDINAPSDLTALASGDEEITLNWVDNSDNETRFVLERSVGDNTNFMTLIELGENITTYTDVSVNVAETYFYRVRAAVNNGSTDLFSDYSNEASIIATNLEENLNKSIKVYPNPNYENFFVLNVDNDYQGKIQVEILDNTGKTLKSKILDKKQKQFEHTISLKDIQRGSYFVKIKIGERNVVKSLIKY